MRADLFLDSLLSLFPEALRGVDRRDEGWEGDLLLA